MKQATNETEEKSLQSMIEACEYVPASELVPPEWCDWFWATVVDNAPFSWGDNNRTLVAFDDFLLHVDDRIDGDGAPPKGLKRKYKRWREWMQGLCDEANHGPVYIDLEN